MSTFNAADRPPSDSGASAKVGRYNGLARINHWIVAISLILLVLSGLAFFFPPFFFLTKLFGGGQAARAFHPLIGVVFFFGFSGLFLRFWRANLWTGDDTAWVKDAPDVVMGNETHLPEIGKYNAGQKLFFWGMSLCVIALFTTGIVIWDEYFFALTGIETKRFAVLLHSLCAIGAITAWFAHVYATMWVRGTLQAMTQGVVTAGWGYKHHRKWLRQRAAEDALEKRNGVLPPAE